MRDFYQHNQSRAHRFIAWLMAVAVFSMPIAAFAEPTHIVPPKNGYSVQDDIRAGQQASAEAERQLPILNDPEAEDLVNRVGQRLVAAIPPEYQHPEFRYSFKVVNASDINAFALPGGYMYVNRGMIQAAHTEGEMAGVMAHELSHVALRHGTAQATKAQKYSIGAAAGQILGSIIGGVGGAVIAQGSQFGIGAYFLKFSREYETQADVLGAQIMARAGYDPRDLANMFKTIEQQGGGGGPQFLSDHPAPANRYARINQEAQLIGPVRNPIGNSAEFRRVQEHLRGIGRAPTTAEIQRNGEQQQRYPQDSRGRDQGSISQRVQLPSTRYRTYTEGNLIRLSVPDNWQELQDQSSVTFSPDGAHGTLSNGAFVFTHGVQIGVTQAQSGDLRQSSDDFINSLLQGNSYLRPQSGYQRTSVAGRSGLAMTLAGRSEVTGRGEVVTVVTSQMRDGNLFYFISVAPQDEQRSYQQTFANVLRSIQLNG